MTPHNTTRHNPSWLAPLLALTLVSCVGYKVEFPEDTGGGGGSGGGDEGADDSGGSGDEGGGADTSGGGDEGGDGCDTQPWYTDADGDGYGDPTTATEACEAPEGTVDHAGDCDDADPAVTTCDWSGTHALADVSDAVLIGEASQDWSGFSVTSAGDVNGDGQDDALVATNQTGGGRGGMYLVTGPISGEQLLSDATASLRQQDAVSVDNYLRGVTALGDVDGDGYDEVSVGDYMAPDGNSAEGAVWLWSGPVTGEHDLEAADASVVGETRSDAVGADPAVAADVDGDGQRDLVVSAIRATSGPGGAYVFLGPVSGEAVLGDAALTVLGTDADAQVGSAVAAGDYDGDGQDDLAVGARYTDVAGQVKSGAIYLISGPPGSDAVDVADADGEIFGDAPSGQLGDELLCRGDLDGDGYDDLLASSPYDGLAGGRTGVLTLYAGPISGAITSADATARIGAMHVQALFYAPFDAGDLNMDGVGDLVVAYENGAHGFGEAMLVYGPLSGTLALDDGDSDAIFEGDRLTAAWVVDAAVGGDLNGDGWSDLLVGAAYAVGATTADDGAGRTHVLFGGGF